MSVKYTCRNSPKKFLDNSYSDSSHVILSIRSANHNMLAFRGSKHSALFNSFGLNTLEKTTLYPETGDLITLSSGSNLYHISMYHMYEF